MSYSSNLTKERIIAVAKQEFLEQGYGKANLREIARKANVTTGALYRHFTSKEELFYRIVKEVYEYTIEYLNSANDTDDIKQRIETNTLEKGFERMVYLKEFIFDHMTEYRLLLKCSKGSMAEDFLSHLTEKYTQSNMEFIRRALEAGAAKKMPSEMSVHFLTSGFLNAVFEIVLHEIPREEAENYFREIGEFQYYGWNGLLGIEEV